MKKSLLFVAGIVIILFSCSKKQNVTPVIPKGLYATINGKKEVFNSYDSVAYGLTLKGYILSVYGSTASGGDTSAIFGFNLVSPLALKPGPYTNSSDSTIIADMDYAFSTMNSNIYGDYSTPYYGKSSAQIVITSLTNNNIQGTFIGTGTPEPGSSPDNGVSINGKFNLDYK